MLKVHSTAGEQSPCKLLHVMFHVSLYVKAEAEWLFAPIVCYT